MSNGAFPFTPDGYRAQVQALLARGYAVRDFASADPAARHLILRHDVDFSMEAACAMAEIEAGIGARSTYFVLLRTEFYSLTSRTGQAALDRIAALGHEIGLHFDAALYPQDEAGIERAVNRECGFLESIAGRPVGTISFHRPAAERIGQCDTIAGRLNAYGPRFVKAMGYCSDSRGGWHHGLPLDHAAVREGRALQLLTHPIWWQSPVMSPEDRVRRFLAERERFLDHEAAQHCTVHRAKQE